MELSGIVTYAVPLSERNLADIETAGPDYLLFDPAITKIDDRYPSLAEAFSAESIRTRLAGRLGSGPQATYRARSG